MSHSARVLVNILDATLPKTDLPYTVDDLLVQRVGRYLFVQARCSYGDAAGRMSNDPGLSPGGTGAGARLLRAAAP